MTKIQFSCNRQVFYAAITHVAKGVAQKSTIPELERLKLRLDHDMLELTGYDPVSYTHLTLPTILRV